MAVLDDLLLVVPWYMTTTHYVLPLIEPTLRWRLALKHRGLRQEAAALQEIYPSRRLLPLGYLMSRAAEDVTVSSLVNCKALAAMWSRAKNQAPLDGLTVIPAVCPSISWRLHCLKAGLCWMIRPSEPLLPDEFLTEGRLARLLFFGLRALTSGVQAVQHGYWSARRCSGDDTFRGFQALLGTADGPEQQQQDAPAVDEPTDEALATRFCTPLQQWRISSAAYSRPLQDDWRPNSSGLPTTWSTLVTNPGGLAFAALFGLQAWMVVADLGVDDLCDLYMTLGLPSQLTGSGVLTKGCSVGEPTTPVVCGSALATAEQFSDVLEHQPDWVQTMNRLLQRPGLGRLHPVWQRHKTPNDWLSTLPSPPTTLPQDATVQLAQIDALKRSWVPHRVFSGVQAAVMAVNDKLPAVGDGSHRRILVEWHRQWNGVLDVACELHDVQGSAREAAQSLPLTGFYPAMRIALDVRFGRWEPLAAADPSQSGGIADGWPEGVA